VTEGSSDRGGTSPDTASEPGLGQASLSGVTNSPSGSEASTSTEGPIAQRSIGGGRYLILEEIGRGGMGIVYAGWDREHDRRVAIKTMRRLGIAMRARFKEEFHSAADVHHRNLAQAYDLIDDGGRLYIIMEFVAGVPFDRYIDEHPHELRDRLGELIAGVLALHGAGYLHLDIKPGNVIVESPSRRAVLLDFGLARFARCREGVPAAGGTPPYVAPERRSRQTADTASDWYSVGVILHRCLTGQVAPQDRTFAAGMPIRPAFREGHADLVSWCRALLDPDPDRRPGGRDLSSVLLDDQPGAPAPAWPLGFAGREEERGALLAAFQDLCRGQPQCLWITGPAGIGKSALVERFLDELEPLDEPRPIVVRARCHEREAIPFKAFDRLADALIDWAAHPPDGAPLRFAEGAIPALAALFPAARVLEEKSPTPPAPAGLANRTDQRSRSFEAFRALAMAVSARTPVLVVVDDIDQADRDSAALFTDVFRSPPPRILLVGTARSTSPADSVFFDELVHRAGSHLSVPTGELPLSGLSLADVQQLVADTDGPTMAPALWAESQGNPGFLEGLYSYWCTRVRGAASAQPVTWDQALEARLEDLPRDLRDLLEVVAVAGKPIPQAIAIEAAGGGVNPLAGGHALASKRFLRVEGTRRSDTLQCYHDRLRDAVVRRMSPESLRRCHLQIAEELARASSDDLEALAYHFHRAGEVGRAAEFALQAALAAERALAFDQAAAFYGKILGWMPAGSARRPTLLVRKARCEASSGRSAAAAADYLAALRLAPDDDNTDLRQAAAEQLLLSGQVDAGLNELAPLLRRHGVPFSTRGLRWKTALEAGRLWLRGLSFLERTESQIPARSLAQADLCAMAARGLVAVDFERGAWFAATALHYALDCGERLRIARALSLGAAILRPLHSGWGHRLLDAAAQIAGEEPSALISGTLLVVRGHLQIMDGDWRAAVESCQAGDALLTAEAVVPTWERNMGRMGILRSLEELGRFTEVRSHGQEWLNDAVHRGNNYAEVIFALFCGMAELIADRPTTARALHHRALARWQQRGFTVQHMYASRLRATWQLYDRSPAQAWQTVSELWPRVLRSSLLSVPITRLDALLLRGRVAVAAAAAGVEGARRVGNRCAWLLAREGRIDALAGSQVLRAALAWGAGQAERSARLLETAAALYRSCGMETMGSFVDRRRAEVEGRPVGPSIDDLTSLLRHRGVGDPDGMAEVLTPGFSGAGWKAR
jgi:eukaryotic-like serine/threonine-protein kinase